MATKKLSRRSGAKAGKGKGLTPNKARAILHDGTVRGHKLTGAQRRFFGAKSKGTTLRFGKGKRKR